MTDGLSELSFLSQLLSWHFALPMLKHSADRIER